MINAIIPARGGSKGIPKKSISPLGTHPLIAYSITAAKLCDTIDRVIVSTDDEEIAKIATAYGAEVPFMRPKKYATDSSSDFGFLKHFFENISCSDVALLRPTTPFRNPVLMREVIATYVRNKNEITGLRTAEKMNQPAHKQLRINNNYFEQLFDDFNGIKDYSNLPRQNFPDTYSPNGYIDIVKNDTIDSGSVFGNKIYAFVTDKMIDIDNDYDLKMANILANSADFSDYLSHLIKKT
jgi:N-acylneuraminate cytidylyltransferase